MAINFPTSLDVLANVSTGDTITPAHKNDLNDIVEELEAKVGIGSSAVATSHDYLLSHLPSQSQDWDAGGIEIRSQTFESYVTTGTIPIGVTSTTKCTNLNADMVDGKHVAGTNGAGEITTNDGTQTLTNKTLTSPDINTGTFNGTIDGNWTAASQTCANLGAVTTCDINGGTVNGLSSLGLSTGTDITEISTDGTMGGNSDNAVPTEKAVVTYASNFSRIKTGTYSGDGSTSKNVTGIGFTPKAVLIGAQATVGSDTYMHFGTTETMPNCLEVYGGTVKYQDDKLIAFASGQFTVDDNGVDDHPNKNGVTYHYTCWG